jgi:hypothetical protein
MAGDEGVRGLITVRKRFLLEGRLHAEEGQHLHSCTTQSKLVDLRVDKRRARAFVDCLLYKRVLAAVLLACVLIVCGPK